MSKSKKGFTLIELLVVIAIIAILAAILFPVFAKAREKARQATCTSNFKQVSMATMQYVQDYDETFPFAHCCPGGAIPPGPYGHLISLDPYMKSAQALLCPSSKNSPCMNIKWAGWTRPSDGQCWNLWGNDRPGVGPMDSATLAQIKSPASVVSVIENPSTVAGGVLRGGLQVFRADWVSRIHSEGMNIAFADGHVKWYNSTSVPGLSGSSGPDYWANATWNGISFDYAYQP